MQNATEEMLCKTFSSVAERADEERFPEKLLDHVAQEGERSPGTENHLVLDQQKIGFPITYQANG
jgi:hypothetical protein